MKTPEQIYEFRTLARALNHGLWALILRGSTGLSAKRLCGRFADTFDSIRLSHSPSVLSLGPSAGGSRGNFDGEIVAWKGLSVHTLALSAEQVSIHFIYDSHDATAVH
jgi:hypothetical protein